MGRYHLDLGCLLMALSQAWLSWEVVDPVIGEACWEVLGHCGHALEGFPSPCLFFYYLKKLLSLISQLPQAAASTPAVMCCLVTDSKAMEGLE